MSGGIKGPLLSQDPVGNKYNIGGF
jgi:hypothetical protein